MGLQYMGIGSAFFPKLKNTSAYFEHNGSLFVLDCGYSVFEILIRQNVFKECKDVYVIVTHLHADHVGSLPTLISYCGNIDKKIHVVHPLKTVVQLLALTGIGEAMYDYYQTLPQAMGVGLEYVPVAHVSDMQSYGCIITLPTWSAYHSGDARQIPQKVLGLFREGKIEKIYQDTARQPSENHGSLPYLEEIFNQEERRRVFCIHIGGDYTQEVKEKGFGIPDICDVEGRPLPTL